MELRDKMSFGEEQVHRTSNLCMIA